MREIDIYQVDAFTDTAFGGNPAGVVPDARGLAEDVMQKIAREMALSETAFIVETPGAAKGTEFDVRFFTPWNEVDLCGHATIGSFWLLSEMGIVRTGEGQARVHQNTKAGRLPVDVLGRGGKPVRVMMTQNPPSVLGRLSGDECAELERILAAPEGSIRSFADLRGASPQIVSTGLPDLIVPVVSREALMSMRPNMAALIDFCNARKVISVHAFCLDPIDPANTVHCRDFSPAVGVPEESATGTASGATGCYLVLNQLVQVQPVTTIICEQGHVLKRPSTIYVEVESKDGTVTGVRVGGTAVTVLQGKIRLP